MAQRPFVTRIGMNNGFVTGVDSEVLVAGDIPGGGGGGGPTSVFREAPAGAVDGSNVTFTLANVPLAGTDCVYLNGLLLEPGAGNDYTLAAGVVTFGAAPAMGDRVRVSYQH